MYKYFFFFINLTLLMCDNYVQGVQLPGKCSNNTLYVIYVKNRDEISLSIACSKNKILRLAIISFQLTMCLRLYIWFSVK